MPWKSSYQVSTLIRPSGRMQHIKCPLIKILHWSTSFNPHPTFRPDATSGSMSSSLTFQFQPSSDLQAGCNLCWWVVLSTLFHKVSTLIRPSGRMQHAAAPTERELLVSTLIRPSGRMQQASGGGTPEGPHVSTLIRPSGRMQPAAGGQPGIAGGPVSTLIRPSGRMQHESGSCQSLKPSGFNPHPTFRPDATVPRP